MSAAPRSFESVAALEAFVGQPAQTAQATVIDQPMIDAFAAITRDHQWIHTEPVRASRESPYRTTIAHGLLTLSLVPGWYQQCFAFPNRKLALNYGFDKIRFTAPVPCGSRVAGSFQLSKLEGFREQEVRCHWKVAVLIEGEDRPALVADWLTQVRY